VASLKPRIRSHAEIHRHEYRGEIWYIVQDHTSNRYQRITPPAYQLIGMMDGERTVDEIWQIGNARLGEDAPTQDEFIRLLSQLHAADILLCDVPPDTLELLRRSEKKNKSRWIQNIRNPLAMRFKLFDPEKFLVRFEPLLRPFFNWFGGLAWLAVVGYACFLVAVHWPEFTQNVTDRVLAPENLVLVWIIFPILKAFHEFGHAFAVRLLKGEVHEMGIIFLVFTPIPYVDASSSLAFRSKWERALVGFAGMAVELFIAAVAVFVWLNVEPGLFRAVAYNVVLIAGVSSLLFNINPLLRFDGYYILMDLLEIPNLSQRGTRYLGYIVQRYLFGIHDAEPPLTSRGERFWLFTYSIASFIYRIFIYAAIIVFIASNFFIAGVLIALWAVASMVVYPLYKGAKFLFSSPKLGRKRARAIAISSVTVTAALAIIFIVPVPLNTSTEGVMWVPDHAFVRAQADSFVERLAVKPGQKILPGELLIECSDPLLPARIRVLEAKLGELQALYGSQTVNDRLQSQITAEEIKHVQSQLHDARKEEKDLMIYSAASGTLLMPNPQDLPGRFVRRGEVMGYVVEPAVITVRVIVSQSEADLVRMRTREVLVRLPERIDEIIHAKLVREVPAATDQLPSRILGQGGGGSVANDPSDKQGMKAFEKIFLFDIELPAYSALFKVGERVYVRFDHGSEPLAWRWYQAFRSMLLRKFNK
jgi:putative peptide zinc metalloprotease protein